MTKKTLYKIFAFAVSVITITAILILSVFYSYSDKQLKEQLLVVENVVEAELMQNGNTDFITNHIDKSVRITLVANDGTVIADNQEDVKNLDNHLQREEIKEAIENGEATVSRYSDTQKGKVYYYAKQLDNGNVLRVSSKATNIGEFFSDYIVYPRTLAHDESVAVQVERTARVLRVVVAGAQRLQRAESGHAERNDRRFGSAADHDVRVVTLDRPERFPDRQYLRPVPAVFFQECHGQLLRSVL